MLSSERINSALPLPLPPPHRPMRLYAALSACWLPLRPRPMRPYVALCGVLRPYAALSAAGASAPNLYFCASAASAAPAPAGAALCSPICLPAPSPPPPRPMPPYAAPCAPGTSAAKMSNRGTEQHNKRHNDGATVQQSKKSNRATEE